MRSNKKGFSIMEVVISVTLIALILSTLGMSLLAVQKLRLNNEITSEIQKCGEMIIDYLFTLPPNDGYIHSVSQNSSDILSLADLVNQNSNDRNRETIIQNLNGILINQARSRGFGILRANNQGNPSRRGALVLFDHTNPASTSNSRIIVNPQGRNNTVTVELYYVWLGAGGRRKGRIIRVSRLFIQ